MTNRIQYIDRLKGLAILGVVLGHIIRLGANIPESVVYSFIASFHMPVFMFLSGYVINVPTSFCKGIQQATRYLLPLLFSGVLLMLFTGYEPFHFMFIPMKGGDWYLMVLAVFNFSLMMNITRWKNIFTTALILFLVYLCGRLFLPLPIRNFLSIDLCCSYFPIFMFGMMSRRFNLIRFLYRYNFIYTISLLVYIVGCYFYCTGKTFVYSFVGFTAVPVFVYLFSLRESYDSLIERVLASFGRDSLTIYMVHYFFVATLDTATTANIIQSIDNPVIEILFLLIISIIIAYLCKLVGYILRRSDMLNKYVFGNIKWKKA